jgi:dipeptidyl aminopeptidase/acylaminoacyl peptidase
MSKVDDELTRRLHRAERPVDGEDLFEGLERRRSHRERVRKVQAGMLVISVVAATAGGFFFLRHVFDPDKRNVGDEQTRAVANGEIVFSRGLPDGSEHLFAVQPGVVGERLITSGSAIYTDPSVAPDGRAIAVVHSIPSFADMNAQGVIATFTMDGGEPTWITDPLPRVGDPSWSPEGDRIAFAASISDEQLPGIYVIGADGSGMRLVAELDGFTLSAPDWSPDGRELVFVGLAAATSEAESVKPDLYTVGIDGFGLNALTETPGVSEWSPSWSRDGDVIAYHRNERNISNSIELIDSTGRPAATVIDDADAGEIGEVDWSPDGRIIAFTSSLALTDADDEGDLDVWTVRVDGSQLTNLTTEGASGISWQPVPAGAEPEPSPTSEPAESASPEPEGRDIGLGFNMCNLERLDEIDFLGDGTQGQAWTGVPVRDDGTCPSLAADVRAVLATDVDGNDLADASSEIEHCTFCRPYDATDLDGDGAQELVVVTSLTSTPTFSIYAVGSGAGPSALEPLFVADPGHPAARIQPEAPLTFSTGGDEGFAGWVGCDGRGGELILEIRWRDHPIEGDIQEVHETGLTLRNGMFHVVSTRDYELPAGAPVPGASDEPACGVDWQLLP